jgi:hypothetical protein
MQGKPELCSAAQATLNGPVSYPLQGGGTPGRTPGRTLGRNPGPLRAALRAAARATIRTAIRSDHQLLVICSALRAAPAPAPAFGSSCTSAAVSSGKAIIGIIAQVKAWA